jgi:uncharacterized protein
MKVPMKHLESAFFGKNSFWRYLAMVVVLIVVSNTIGALPLLVVYFRAILRDPAIAEQISENPSDVSVLNMDPYTGLVVMLIPFVAALIAFVLLMKPLHGRKPITVINGGSRTRWSHYFISFFVWSLISALYLFVYLKIEPSNFTINNNTITLLYIAIVALMLIPFQAGMEEMVFRGYLMQGFGLLVRNRWFPLVVTSVFFGLLHGFNPEVREYGFFVMMPQYMVFGLIFGIVTVMDDGIEAALGAHAANNIFLVIMVTHDSSALQTPAYFQQNEVNPWIEFSGLIVSGIIFIVVLRYIFRWGSFSVLASEIEEPAEQKTIQDIF